MSGHTPGPWMYDMGYTGAMIHQYDPNGYKTPIGCPRYIADVHQHTTDDGPAQSEADARLIAAAPELLEVLAEVEALTEGAHDYATDTGPSCWIDVHGLVVEIRAAIAKARGEG